MIFHRYLLQMQRSELFWIKNILAIHMNQLWSKWKKSLNKWFVRIYVGPAYRLNITHGAELISTKVRNSSYFVKTWAYLLGKRSILAQKTPNYPKKIFFNKPRNYAFRTKTAHFSQKLWIWTENLCTLNKTLHNDPECALYERIYPFWIDLTAVFSITNCKSTWETFHHARKERLLLIAITDPDCPRLPMHEAITVSRRCICYMLKSSDFNCGSRVIGLYWNAYLIQIPRIGVGVELPQILLDIRTSKSINWKTATILYDDIFGTCDLNLRIK